MGRSFSPELVLSVLTSSMASRVRFADSDGVDDGAGAGAGCIDLDCARSPSLFLNTTGGLCSLIYRVELFRVSNPLAWRVSSNGDERARMYGGTYGRMVQQSGLVHPSVRDTSSTRRRRVKQEKGARGAAEHETGPEYFFSLYMTDGNKQSVSKQRREKRSEISDSLMRLISIANAIVPPIGSLRLRL